jgi:adenine-specific DNA-methyltransferase
MNGQSLDIRQTQLEKLKELFPEVVSEGKVDWEKLKATLGEDITLANERYVLNWAGKSDAFKALQTPSGKTLVPDKEESVKFDTTQNLFIEGENLEVLKVLQKSYFGKVKMIYIDPPYNTGNDSFIYPDNFSETKAEYQKRVGDKDEEGYMTKDGLFQKNSKENGQYHSNWLNMMYPRLFLAKNLLKQDGVIFISIDDNEVHNLRLLMNEVFGEENFIASVIWQRVYSPKNSAKYFSEDHDYILVYAKDAETWRPNLLPRTEEANERYKNPDNDPRGKWKPSDLTARNYYGDGQYEITGPTGKKFTPGKGRYWRQSFPNFQKLIEEDRVWWGPNKDSMPSQKRFLSEVMQGRIPQTLWKYEEVGHTQDAKKELLKYVSFDETENILNTVKPTKLLQRIIQIGTQKDSNDIVLDFFSGSGPCAHALMAQNILDGGNRKFLLVQLAEPLPKEEKTAKSIADFSRSRIKNYAEEQEKRLSESLDFDEIKHDLGFKSMRLVDSNFKQWRQIKGKDARALEEQMQLFVDPVSKTATTENMVYELLLKSGKDLNSAIEHKEGYHSINGNELILLLEKATQAIVDAVLQVQPQKVIALDRLFKNNDQLKTNTALQMKDAGIEFKTI